MILTIYLAGMVMDNRDKSLIGPNSKIWFIISSKPIHKKICEAFGRFGLAWTGAKVGRAEFSQTRTLLKPSI